MDPQKRRDTKHATHNYKLIATILLQAYVVRKEVSKTLAHTFSIKQIPIHPYHRLYSITRKTNSLF